MKYKHYPLQRLVRRYQKKNDKKRGCDSYHGNTCISYDIIKLSS